MNDRTILNLSRLPARLTGDQAAELLGFTATEIPILMRAKLLKPLGDPAQNGHKFFCAYEIEALSKQRDWLSTASKTVTKFRRAKNRTSQEPLKCAIE
ncbi:MAG: hypothetical protein ACXWJX_14170 [Limisphaerales bacterium]